MINPISFKASIAYNKEVEEKMPQESPNPLRLKANLSSLSAMSNYNQVLLKPKFDNDSAQVMDRVDELMNLTPKKISLPHSYKIDEINGERIFNSNGDLLLIRDYENGVIKEYYPSKDGINVQMILEKDKDSNEIISSIEPFYANDGNIKTKLTIFDNKINNQYVMFTIENDSSISSVTKFSTKANNFKTLFINPYTKTPERYVELKEDTQGEFETIDSHIGQNKEVVDIKKVTPYKEMIIKYEDGKKIIDVKKRD